MGKFANVDEGQGKPLKPQCCERVTRYIGNWPKPGQCERKGIVEAGGKFYCKQHSPAAVKKRTETARAKWEAKSKQWFLEKKGPAAHNVLQQIADGHNDARGLAKAFLEGRNYDGL